MVDLRGGVCGTELCWCRAGYLVDLSANHRTMDAKHGQYAEHASSDVIGLLTYAVNCKFYDTHQLVEAVLSTTSTAAVWFVGFPVILQARLPPRQKCIVCAVFL